MRLTSMAQITATALAIPVTITPSSVRAYAGRPVDLTVDWSGYPFNPTPPFYIHIDWGDGLASDQYVSAPPKTVVIEHIYSKIGVFTVNVTVIDQVTLNSGYGSATVAVASLMSITLSATPSSGPAPLSVSFALAISGGAAPYTYTLDYGNGTAIGSGIIISAGTTTIPHVYAAVGKYTAVATVTDAFGESVMGLVGVVSGVMGWWASLNALQKALVVVGVAGSVVVVVAVTRKKR